jgi:HrpA-like RNA helicase
MDFWKPADAFIDRGDQDSFKDLHNTRNKHLSLSYQRQLLPISRLKREILYAIEEYKTVVLVGETGPALSYC